MRPIFFFGGILSAGEKSDKLGGIPSFGPSLYMVYTCIFMNDMHMHPQNVVVAVPTVLYLCVSFQRSIFAIC